MHCPLFERASRTPHLPALITDERSFSYLELNAMVESLDNIEPLKRVAFVAEPDWKTVVLFFALFRSQAIACPLSPHLPQALLEQSIAQLKATRVSVEFTQTRCLSNIALEQEATLLFTSGSSNRPKIACHTFANHYYSALGIIDALHLNTTSRYLLSLPLFHVSGLSILFRCFLAGACVVLTKRPLSEAIAHFQITHLSLVPTQLYRLLQQESRLSSLQTLLLGGAACPDSLLQKGLSQGLPLLTSYGMTEMSSTIALSGELLPFREMCIDATKEIWVKGKTLFKGYWDPETEKITGYDWFPTKDLGEIKSEKLCIIGRKDRQFISGGENIQPEEIERALLSLHGIHKAKVVPVADVEFGKRPTAYIDATHLYSLETIREKLQKVLPSYKLPVALFPYPLSTPEKLES